MEKFALISLAIIATGVSGVSVEKSALGFREINGGLVTIEENDFVGKKLA